MGILLSSPCRRATFSGPDRLHERYLLEFQFSMDQIRQPVWAQRVAAGAHGGTRVDNRAPLACCAHFLIYPNKKGEQDRQTDQPGDSARPTRADGT